MSHAADIFNARILIVDDQKENILLLERMLRGADYRSLTSTMDSAAVRELHHKHRYDFILLDLQMPGMSGFQVMGGLREGAQDSYLPILVITAQPDHKLRALQSGAKDFVSKPIDPAEVLARVHNLLEVRLLQDAMKRYSTALEDKIEEVQAGHDLMSRQKDEVKRLYDELVLERKRSIELSLQPGAMVGVHDDERFATRWHRSLRLRHPWQRACEMTRLLMAVGRSK